MDMALSPDYQLLTVVQNNVLKGFISNMLPLRLTQALISQEDSMSIFVLQPNDRWRRTFIQLPPSLEPSSLQLTVPHHPWTDILPCSKLRDNIILALRSMSDEQQTELCEDIVGAGKLQAAGHGPGLLLWGDAFCLENWEVSEALLKKWCDIFKNCSILLKASGLRGYHRGFRVLRASPFIWVLCL